MKRAASSFSLLIISTLFVSFQSYGQINWQEPGHGNARDQRNQIPQYPDSYSSTGSETISQRIQQSLRMGDRLGLSELLRLSPQEQRQIQVLSLSISAQSLRGPGRLEVLSLGRLIGQQSLRRELGQQQILIPSGSLLSDLEISVREDSYIDSISAEIIRPRQQGGGGWNQPREQQPMPQQLLSLRVDQEIRGMGKIPLEQLVRQQLGLTLEGAEIERVVIQAQPLMYSRSASVQVELNNRLVGPMKLISSMQIRTPLPVNSREEVRSLRLIVSGDVRISDIQIRIGQVRPIFSQDGQGQGQSQRIMVSQEISSQCPLELSALLPYENRLVRSISIEARSLRSQSAEVALLSSMSEVLASVVVSQVPMRPVLQLMHPMSVRELRLQSLSSVMIDSIELNFDRFPR